MNSNRLYRLCFVPTTVVLSLATSLQLAATSMARFTASVTQQTDDFAFWEAQCYERVGREAIEACDRAIAINPNHTGVWVGKGYAQEILRRYEEALDSYNQAIALDSNYSYALLGRCVNLNRLQHYTEAILACELAIKGDQRWGSGNSSAAWNNRGWALEQLERYDEALLSYEQALEVDPNDEISRENLEYLHQKIEELELQENNQ